jgi:hypothetical protein
VGNASGGGSGGTNDAGGNGSAGAGVGSFRSSSAVNTATTGGAGTGSGSVVITVLPRSIACIPGDGSTIIAGDRVECGFQPSSGDSFSGWTASGFAPTSSTSAAAKFTGGGASSGATITANWTDSTNTAQSQTFTYAIVAQPSCTPGSTSSITVDILDQVSCSFPSGTSDTLIGWTASGGFSPTASSSDTPTFSAQTAGTSQLISLSWSDFSNAGHEASFAYTIAAPSCSLGSTSATTSIEATDSVDCSFTLGSGDSFATGQGWTETGGFSPQTSASATPTFTAPSSRGSGSLSVSWTGNTGAVHSQSFAYSFLTLSCSPRVGTTLLVGDQVSCTFTAGTGDTGFQWTAVDFTPSPSTATSQTFTAGAPGSGSITTIWTDANGVTHATPFAYTLAAPSCTPAAGVAVLPGARVYCVFTPTAQDSFSGWSGGAGVAPTTSPNQTQALYLNQLGTDTITVHWLQGGTTARSASFSYPVTLTPLAPSISCAPETGSSIGVGQTVSCSWTAGNAAESLKGWTASGMSSASSTSPTPTFTALRAGPATLSVSWTDSRGHGQSQTFR